MKTRKDRGPDVTVTLPPVYRRSRRRDKLVKAGVIKVDGIDIKVGQLAEGFVLILLTISVECFFKRFETLVEVVGRRASTQNAFSLKLGAPAGVVAGCPDVADAATVVGAVDMLVAHLLADTAYEVGEGNWISAGYLVCVF